MADTAEEIDPRILRTRSVVVAATADLLTEDGFNGITIEAIAERSGVARSTIYRNWPERAELLVAGFESLCWFSEVPDLGSLDAELHHLGNELCEGLNNEAWGTVLPSLVGAALGDPDIAEAQRRFSGRRRQISAQAFKRARTRSEIPEHADAEALAELFVSGFFFRKLVAHTALDSAFVERQIALVRAAANAA